MWEPHKNQKKKFLENKQVLFYWLHLLISDNMLIKDEKRKERK